MSNLRNLVEDELIVAECSGLNYTLCVTESRLLVSKRFEPNGKYVNVLHSKISSLELITKSLLPPIAIAIVAIAGGLIVWWFPGGGQASLPAFPYNLVLFGLGAVFAEALAALVWRKRVAVLRIRVAGIQDPIIVKPVGIHKAEVVFRALKG